MKETTFLAEVSDSEVARLAAAGAVHGGGAWLGTPAQHQGDCCRGNTCGRRGGGGGCINLKVLTTGQAEVVLNDHLCPGSSHKSAFFPGLRACSLIPRFNSPAPFPGSTPQILSYVWAWEQSYRPCRIAVAALIFSITKHSDFSL